MSQKSSFILPEGTIVGSYEIIESIGQGGFGITYKARHIKTGIIRAIKEYFPSDYASRARDGISVVSHSQEREKDIYKWGLESFLEEAKTLAKFNYPTIVKIIDYFDANNTAYMVMEYYEGETLKKYLKRNKNKTFSQDEILNIIMPILEGLKEVHSKGYLHRDIAPDNILLRKNYLPVLIDFGSSRNAIGNKSKTLTAIIKPGYSPPEQYTFNSNQNATADIYAICAVMYEMITGKRPPESIHRQSEIFNGNSDLIEDIVTVYKGQYSKSFLEAIMQGLALRANERIQSVKELQERLVGDISEPPLPEPPEENVVTLRDYFKANEDKHYSEKEIRDFIKPLIEKIKDIHSNGDIHGKVLPSNINYVFENGKFKLKLGKKQKSFSQKGTFTVEEGYSPIEAYLDLPNLTKQSDIYGLGAIMYKMVTGEKPPSATFRSTEIAKGEKDPLPDIVKRYKHKYSESLLKTIDKSLSLYAKNRFENIKEFEDCLNGNIKCEKGGKYDVWDWIVILLFALPFILALLAILLK